MQNIKIKYSELVLIIFVWLVLLFTPILFREDIYSPIRRSILLQLQILIPLLVVFLINRFILVPRLLFKGKQVFFIASVLGLIILFTAGSYIYDTKFKNVPPPEVPTLEDQIKSPPYAFPGGVDQFGNLRPAQTRQPRPIPPFANFLILSILFVGFDTGLRSGLRGINIENEKVRLEKENVASQLVLLRNQVSPHFLMNTLNNIHSLVDVNAEEAKEAIIKLSKMMRYLLYETETEKTTLKKEIEFLESYISLMKLRFNEKVSITLNLPATIPEKTIPPFIFTSLIENAFKHGISYKDESFINIDIIIGEERLLLVVKNSKTDKSQIEEFSGIGIENTRKRLKLLYGNNYHLDIIDNKDLFTVNLSIPL
ncbi:MAG: histidine kinase [Bacteroidia bacterium]|nr:histidine kinase [Bacteroidia bacterium]